MYNTKLGNFRKKDLDDMKVDINKQKQYDFDDFIEDYTVIRKEYLKVEFSPSDIVIILTSIFLPFCSFFRQCFLISTLKG